MEKFRRTYIDPRFHPETEENEVGTRVSICDYGEEYYAGIEVPGVDVKGLKVEATNFELSVEGDSDEEWEMNATKAKVLVNERTTGKIYRKLTFSEEIKPEEAKATLKNGVLSVTIPKKNPKTAGMTVPIKVEIPLA
jgi:HSP20 family protein